MPDELVARCRDEDGGSPNLFHQSHGYHLGLSSSLRPSGFFLRSLFITRIYRHRCKCLLGLTGNRSDLQTRL
jgi:hypothetical protein